MRKNILLNICLIILACFIIPAFWMPERVLELTTQFNLFLLKIFADFYLWLGLILFVFCVGLAISPLGKKRLGNDDDRPEYSFWSWIAMLYSAGMGAGLLQRAAQEPVQYYINSPVPADQIEHAHSLALQYAYFHWGFNAWAFYAVFGLIIAWVHFRKKKPALTSSTLGSVGENKFGKTSIDVMALVATIVGLTSSVGLGSGQIIGGFNHLFSADFGISLHIGIVILISIGAFISAMTGLDKGIRIISNINMSGTLFLLVVFLFHSDIGKLCSEMSIAFWQYCRDFVQMSLAYGRYGENSQFVADWTIFYWAFWLAWTPFTGLFIARISKGRTIRSFMFGVLLVPSLGTFLWFSVFGSSVFELVDAMSVYDGRFDDIFSATYQYFEYFPWSTFMSWVTVFLLCTYLITSLDSAIYVLSIMSDGGVDNPARRHKITWGIIVPLFAISSILVGGDTLLKSVSNLLIIMALPFAFIMVVMMGVFIKKEFFIKK